MKMVLAQMASLIVPVRLGVRTEFSNANGECANTTRISVLINFGLIIIN